MVKAVDRIKEVAESTGERHRQKLLTLASTGRHIVVSFPDDLTDQELLDFLGYLTHEFRAQLPQMVGGLVISRAQAIVDA